MNNVYASSLDFLDGLTFTLLNSNKALADTVDSLNATLTTTENSQNIALLQADVSTVSILQAQKTEINPKVTTTAIDDGTIQILSENALLPANDLMTTPDEIEVGESYSDQINVYVVRKGDSISQIAEMFEVSVNTILWANELNKSSTIKEGDILLILPVSGVEHTVTKGETVNSIATLLKADETDIIAYNDISEGDVLTVGQKIFVPDGEMNDKGGDQPSPSLSYSVAKDQDYYKTHPLLQNLIGYFINPVPTGLKTQGLHGPGRRGIDIGAPTGTNIYASASGIVTAVKTGCVKGQRRCGGGYGNFVTIQHSNGTKTLYGHMSKIASDIYGGVSASQGQVIGYIGSTGRSTGPHLHFEVFNAKNPGSDWSWAN